MELLGGISYEPAAVGAMELYCQSLGDLQVLCQRADSYAPCPRILRGIHACINLARQLRREPQRERVHRPRRHDDRQFRPRIPLHPIPRLETPATPP